MELAEIVERAEKAYRSGVVPRRCNYGVNVYPGKPFTATGGGCCGVSAAAIGLTIPSDISLDKGPIHLFLTVLEISDMQYHSFCWGFDNNPGPDKRERDWDDLNAWWQAGRDLANRWSKEMEWNLLKL